MSENNKNNTKLSIIVVNWNVKSLLERCLASIFKYLNNINYEVIVVDNASQDGSRERLKQLNEKKQRVKIILNKKNLGFAAANNKGLKKAKGQFILFLNPDTEIRSESIENMIDKIKNYKDVGLVGPQVFGVSGKVQPSVRSFPAVLSQALIFLKLHHVFPRLPALKNYFQNDFDYKKESEVDQVMGAAMMTKKDILERVGGWDENFFLWFEDVDLCKKMKDAGWKVLYTPKAQIFHHGGESFGQVFSFKKQLIYNKSAICYFKKYACLKRYWLLLVLHPISVFVSLIVQILNIPSNYGDSSKN